MLAVVMSYCHYHHYVKGAGHPVKVLTYHHNLERFMTTKSLTDWQECWRETLSGYNLSIVYREGKKNPADAPSCQPDYVKAPEGRTGLSEGLCITVVLIAQCNATFLLLQLYVATVQENCIFGDVSPNSLLNLIHVGLAVDYTAKEVRIALSLLSVFLAEIYSIPATLLC